MATKRIASSSVDWAAFAARVPEAQKPMFNSFKAKSDLYLRRVAALPDGVPAINWEYYKARITIPGMIEEFKKQYDVLKVPYPMDKYTSQIDEVEKQMVASVKAFKAESNKKITAYQAEIEGIKKMIPYEEMTLEEFAEAQPELALRPLERPQMWPFVPEVQPGYVPPEGVEQNQH